MTFRFIAEYWGDGPIAWARGALEVSEPGYHAWSPEPGPPQARGALVTAIEVIHAEVQGAVREPPDDARVERPRAPARRTRGRS